MCCQMCPSYLICLDNPLLSSFYWNHFNTEGRGSATSQLLVSGGGYWQHPSASDQTCLMTAIISTLQISRSDYLDTAAAQLSPLTDISTASQLGSVAAIDQRRLSRKLGMPLGIDPALARPLRDIDPDHLSVSHGSVVSGLGVLEMQCDWCVDVSVTQQQPHIIRNL